LPTLDYSIVDVFTREPLKGNPLAVVMNTCGLGTEQMQRIAREFNLSETTFVERRAEAIERAEGVRVRIFTTQEELQFAGHPTLGTASVLKMLASETLRGDTVTLAENVGPIPVRFEDRDGEDGGAAAGLAPALFAEMTQRDAEFGAELDRAEVARLAGLNADDVDAALTPQVVSTGTPFAIVVLRSVEALGRLKVNHDAATEWLRERGARWFYFLAPALNQNQENIARATDAEQSQKKTKCWRARMQFYGAEDPATGSAAGCAIAYLVARGAVPEATRVHVQQGVEMGRPSDLFLSARKESARVTDVRVAGSTVLVANGRLFLP